MTDEDDFADRDAEDPNPRADVVDLEKVCRRCRQPSSMLHQDPERINEPRRIICGTCQGLANRRITDALRPRKSDAPHETARKGSW